MFGVKVDKSKTSKKSIPKKKLEQLKKDPFLWIETMIKIPDNLNGGLIPFKAHDQQIYLEKNMKRFNIISKPRQLGMSVWCIAKMIRDACVYDNTAHAVFVHDESGKNILLEKLKNMLESLPKGEEPYAELIPKITRNSRDGIAFANGSSIIIEEVGTGNKGRGGTFLNILLSEFAHYKDDQQDKILVSMEDALVKSPLARLTLESTSNGLNPYYKLFVDAWNKKNKYQAFFFPFYSSAYKELNKYDLELAVQLFREQHGRDMLVTDLDDYELGIYNKCKDLSFLAWRRYKINDLTDVSKVNKFKQENPSSYLESFLQSGTRVFSQEKIMAAIDNISPSLRLESIEKLPEILKPYINKQLFIYDTPKKGVLYFSGIDVASGGGEDLSTISIIDENENQVASFYHNLLAPYEFSDILNALGRFFNYAHLVVERNGGWGMSVLEKLRKEHGYLNLYKYREPLSKGAKKKKREIGWVSSQVSKNVMINHLKEEFQLDRLNINCRETLEQMLLFEEDNGKMGAKRANGHHFDLVISIGLAVEGLRKREYFVLPESVVV